MVAQVVIGVLDQHGERDASPQLVQLCGGSGGGVLDDLRDLEIAALLAVGCFEHRHGADIADAATCKGAVEPVDDQDVATGQPEKPRRWHVDAGQPGEVQDDLLPGHHIPGVVVGAGELREGEPAVPGEHVRLGASPAEGAADAEEPLQVGQISGVVLGSGGQVQQGGQIGQRRYARVVLGEERSVTSAEPERPLAQVVSDTEQVVDLAESGGGSSLGTGERGFRAGEQGASPAIRRTSGRAPNRALPTRVGRAPLASGSSGSSA